MTARQQLIDSKHDIVDEECKLTNSVISSLWLVVRRIGPFNPEHEDWTLYSEQVDFYFIANGIIGVDKKRATFLSLIGADTYKTLCSVIVPAAPKDMSYEELKKDHFAPKRSQVYTNILLFRILQVSVETKHVGC